ncbi:uncharacterized protein LOC143021033 isoform X2 [Oratosquilla oratoria]
MASNARYVVNMANSIVGVSILSVPYCFKETGLVLGMLTVLTCGFITKKTSMFLIRSAIMTRRRSYEFLAFHVFGVSGKLFVELCMILFLIGICISFHVVMGDLAPAIIAKLFSVENTPALRCTLLIGVAVLIILPLCLLRNLDSLSSMSATSIGFYFFLVSVILIHALPKLLDGSWLHVVELWKPKGLFQVFPIISLALACQSNVFEIYDSLVDPDVVKMRNVVTHAVNLCCGLYIAVGFLGYVAFADKDFGGNIVMSFPGSELTEFIKLFFAVSLAISFPLMIFPCRTSIHSLLYRRNAQTSFDLVGNYMPEARFKGITLGILTISLTIGIMIPNIEFVLGLLGSTMGMTIALILPSLMFIKVNSKASAERLVAQGIMFIGAFLIVTGTYLNLKNISDSDVAQRPNIQPDLLKQNLDPQLVDGNALEKNVGDLVQEKVGIVENKPLGLEKVQQKINEMIEDPSQKITDSATRKEPVAPEPPPDLDKKVKAVDPVKKADVEIAPSKVVKEVVMEKPKENKVVKLEEKPGDDLDPDAIEKEEAENKEEKGREDVEKEEFENKQDTILQKIEEQNKQQEEILAQQKKILEELKKSKDTDVEGRRQEDQPQPKRVENVAVPEADKNVVGLADQVKVQAVPANAPGVQQGGVGMLSWSQNVPSGVQNVQSNIAQPNNLGVQSGNVPPVIGAQNPVSLNIQNNPQQNNQNVLPNQANVQNVPMNPQVAQQAIAVHQVIPIQPGAQVQLGLQIQPGGQAMNNPLPNSNVWNAASQLQYSQGNMQPNMANPQGAFVIPQYAVQNAQTGAQVAQPAVQNAQAGVQVAQPVLQVAQPVLQVAQPAVQAAQPVLQAAQPAVQAAQPVLQAAQPAVQAAQPVLQAAQPAVQAAQPVVQAAQPAVQVPQPVVQAAQPAVQAAQPAVQAAQPAVQVPQPVVQAAQPAVQVAQPAVQAAQPAVQAAQGGAGNAQANVANAQGRGPNPGDPAGQKPPAAAATHQSKVQKGKAKQSDKLPESAKLTSNQQNKKPAVNGEQPKKKVESPQVQGEKNPKKNVKQSNDAKQGTVPKVVVQTNPASANNKESKVNEPAKPGAVAPNSVRSQAPFLEEDKTKKKENMDVNKIDNGPVMNHLQNKGNVKESSKMEADKSVVEKKMKKATQVEDQKKKTVQKEDQKKKVEQKEDKKQLTQKKEEQKMELAQKEKQKKPPLKEEEQKKLAQKQEELKKLTQVEVEKKKLAQKGKEKKVTHDEERKKRGAPQDDFVNVKPPEEQNEAPEYDPYNFNLPNVDLKRDLKRRSVGELGYEIRHLLWNEGEGTDKKYRGTV